MRLVYSAVSVVVALLLVSCSGSQTDSVDLGWIPDTPATYRVSISSGSSFSGPTSDVESATDLTAALRVSPVSASQADVEIVYIAASVSDGSGEMVALGLPDLAGREATVRFEPPGVVSEVSLDEELLDARIPLVPLEDVFASLFPPLPEGSFRPGDTWTGDSGSPFSNLGGEPVRMRYVMGSVDGDAATVEGYELALRPRTFVYETGEGSVTGEGRFDIEFEGNLTESAGYEETVRRSDFDTDYIRLEGGGYANGNLHMESETVVRRLNVTEQFGTGL